MSPSTNHATGRLDLLLLRMVEQLVREKIASLEQRFDVPLWEGKGGLRDVSLAVIQGFGVPSQPITALDIVRAMGLLPEPAKGGPRAGA